VWGDWSIFIARRLKKVEGQVRPLQRLMLLAARMRGSGVPIAQACGTGLAGRLPIPIPGNAGTFFGTSLFPRYVTVSSKH